MALILVIMTLTLLAALGGGLAVQMSVERRLAFSFADSIEALYAAEAAANVVALQVAEAAIWNPTPGLYVSAPLDQVLGTGGGSRWTVTVTLDVTGGPDEAAVSSRATAPGSLARTVTLGFRRVVDAAGHPALQVTTWADGP